MRQTLDKIATISLRFILPISAFLIPIFMLPNTPNFYDFNKAYLIYVLATISLIAWTIRMITRRRLQITITPATLPLFGLSLIFIISSVVQSPTPIISLLNKTATIFSLFIIFIATTSSQKNSITTTSTIIALIASTLLINFIALMSSLELSPLSFLPFANDKNFNPTGSPWSYLSLSLTLLPGIIFLAIKTTSSLNKIALFATAAIIITSSISVINNLFTTGQSTWPYLPLSAGWSIMIDIFKNLRSALLGTGPENYLSTFTRLRPAYLNMTSVWATRFTSSSNELLNIITTTGLIGGFFYITSFITPLITSKKTPHRSGLHSFTMITLLASFIINFIIPTNITLLFTTFAIITVLSLLQKLESDKGKDFSLNLLATTTPITQSNPDHLPQDKHPLNQLLIMIFALPSIVLIVFFWLYAGKTYAAALATKKAIDTLNTNPVESYNQQIKAYTLDPYNPIYRINFSQTSFALANNIATKKDLTDEEKTNITQLVSQSIREAKNATAINPQDVTNWENLANLYRQLINFAEGSIDWAIASYNQAIILDPVNPLLRLELGGIYFALGDFDQAIKLFGQSIDLKPDLPNSHYNLAAAYKANNNLRKTVEEMRIVVQLLDPNSNDYQIAQNELAEVEKQLSSQTQKTTPKETEKPQENQNIELVTPTPVIPQTPIKLPEESAPNIPEPTPSEITPTPNPTEAAPSPIN